MRHLHTMNGIADGTKDYIISKCKYDANFVVRMVCAEVEKGANKEQRRKPVEWLIIATNTSVIV